MGSSYKLRLRVFLLSLEPAIRLACALRLDLDDVRDAVAAQYVLRLRDRGLSLEQIARRIGKSRRTVVTLSRTASAITEQLEGSRSMSLRREIVRLVSSHRSLTVDELLERVPNPQASVHSALEVLIEDRFLRLDSDRLSLARRWLPFDGEAEAERLDSVRHFLGAVTSALRGRFFDWPPSEEAFARVLTFSADPTRLTEAQESVFARIKERAVQLDAEAGEDAVSVSVAFCTGAVEP